MITHRMMQCFYCDQWVIVERRNRTTNYTFDVNTGNLHKCPEYRRYQLNERLLK
jgi:hypothetical protein